MQSSIHWIRLDVCDYTDKPLCNLYDSDKDVSGQATEVIVHSERNGFKELSFQLPSMCSTENGQERNYRLDFLVSDYKLKVQKSLANNDEIETDWFLISETKVTHNNFSENYEIRASHVSKLLSIKKLDLEFSEEEGNNVGTIKEIAQTILEGTGWHLAQVADFYEEEKYGQPENTLKVRSFSAAVQTGAFKMMSDLCELFDAKPIYHGEGKYQGYRVVGTNQDNNTVVFRDKCDAYEANKAADEAKKTNLRNIRIEDIGMIVGKTVDIIPMNPFSEDYEEGTIPKNIIFDKVIELHYDKNIHSITRTLNTENLITKLSAYGSYGDRNGMCSLQKATHFVLSFNKVNANQEYKFEFNSASYYFTPDKETTGLKWSSLDFASRSYVYNGTDLYKVYKTPKTSNYSTPQNFFSVSEETNYLPFVMDYSYYEKIGLLTDDMLRSIAEFQTSIPQKYYEAEVASANLAETQAQMMEIAYASNGYLKFDVAGSYISYSPNDVYEGHLLLVLDTSEYEDGIIYRSDYYNAKRNYFPWNVAKSITDQGQSVAGLGSVVYIINQQSNQHTNWVKSYVKMVGNENGMYFSDNMGGYYVLKYKQPYNELAVGQSNIMYYDSNTDKMYAWKENRYIEILPCNYEYGLNYFDEPDRLVLWTSEDAWKPQFSVFMFSADSISGSFGVKEDALNSNQQTIENLNKVATETHPIYFIGENDSEPSPDATLLNYGWYYRSREESFEFGELYFCWGKAGSLNWSETYDYEPNEEQAGDTGWVKVYVSKGSENPEVNPTINPESGVYGYYYSYRLQKLYKGIDGSWKPLNLDLTDSSYVNSAFKVVLNGCVEQDYLTKGYCDMYYYNIKYDDLVDEVFPKTNYAFKNEYDRYWAFSISDDVILHEHDRIRYYPSLKNVWVDDNGDNILPSKEYSFDSLDFPKDNELFQINFNQGGFDWETKTILDNGSLYISNNINGIHPDTVYECNLPPSSIIVFFSDNMPGKGLDMTTASEFTTPKNTDYIRIICETQPTNNNYLRVKNYETCFFIEDKQYKILNCKSEGDRKGIYNLMDKFIELSDRAYLVELINLRTAQEYINQANLDLANTLGDMYREGYWQKNDYVEGDEYKLYVDTLDNLKEVSHPEATYDISYIDLYGSDKNIGLSIDDRFEDIDWCDVDISYAAHLVDPDIDINCWAYIDTVDTCYDQPWKTNIEINTKLSMIGQQSFTDVLSHIAEVATETKAKQTIYGRAQNINSSGALDGDKVEGSIETGKVSIDGGTANWYTDGKGNIIFESADITSAVMLSSRGIMYSQEKDQYGNWLWITALNGKGFNGDVINLTNNPSITNLLNKVQNLSDKYAGLNIEYMTTNDIDEVCI